MGLRQVDRYVGRVSEEIDIKESLWVDRGTACEGRYGRPGAPRPPLSKNVDAFNRQCTHGRCAGLRCSSSTAITCLRGTVNGCGRRALIWTSCGLVAVGLVSRRGRSEGSFGLASDLAQPHADAAYGVGARAETLEGGVGLTADRTSAANVDRLLARDRLSKCARVGVGRRSCGSGRALAQVHVAVGEPPRRSSKGCRRSCGGKPKHNPARAGAG